MENNTDLSVTEDDCDHLTAQTSEFLSSFVIVGVDMAGNTVSIIKCADCEEERRSLTAALTWFYNNKLNGTD